MPESVSFRATLPPFNAAGFRSAVWKHGVPGPDEAYEPLHPTLVAALDAISKRSKVGVTLLADDEDDPDTHMTWAEIARRSRHLAASLARRGVRKGDPVLIVFGTSFDFLIAFFALLVLGAIPVPSYPPAVLEKLEVALGRLSHVARAAGVRTCLTNATFYPLLGELAGAVPTLEEIIATDRLSDGADAKAVAERVAPDDVCFLQYTSGSTDNAKGVTLTHRNVVANIHVIGQRAKVNRHDVMVSWLPLYHDMGLIGAVLSSMFFQMPLVLMSPLAFLERPVRWLRAIQEHKGTITASPNFGYALCVKRVRESERRGLDLSSWRLAMNGAEPVHLRTLIDFERMFGPHGFDKNAVLPVYGLAESALAVTFPDPGAPIKFKVVDRTALANGHVVEARGRGSLAIVSVGRPMPGHSVFVVDHEGRPVPPGEVGHVVVRGPSVMRGYWRDEETTKSVLRRGALWTGDLGFVQDGDLYITGRAKDVIIHRGKNYYAEDIERVVERIKGVRPGGVVVFSLSDDEKQEEQTVVLCETSLTEPEDTAALVAAIGEAMTADVGLRPGEIVLAPPGTIPRTSSGKRQRALSRRLYINGELLKSKKTGKLRAALIVMRSRLGLWTLAGRKKRAARSSGEP